MRARSNTVAIVGAALLVAIFGNVLAVAAFSGAGKAPSLPATVPTAFGPAAVTTAPLDSLMDGDTPLYGKVNLQTFLITIREGMSPTFSRYVLDHETCHIAVLEVDINDDKLEERLCDAYARQRAAERRAQ